jgi:hypothetical protein
MTRRLSTFVGLALVFFAIPLRAAEKPHAGTKDQNSVVWTNDDLQKLHNLGLISIVGQAEKVESASSQQPGPYVDTQDPRWYAVQAEILRVEIDRQQTLLRDYRQALADARSLGKTAGGLNLDQDGVGITPEAGLEILERSLDEVEAELDDLQDLGRVNGIPPGALRGR